MTTRRLPLPPTFGPEPINIQLIQAIQAHLGQQLRALYGDPTEGTLPRNLSALVARLEAAIHAREVPYDKAFADDLLSCTKSLRAFALSLTKNADRADDLVQDTILKALSKHDHFTPGTNLPAWCFTIMRNAFHTQYRKVKREVEDADGAYADTLITIPDQIANLEMQDFEAALAKIPQDQSDALMLIAADGLSYEEAGQVLGVKVGTIKSRVNRARNQLAQLLGVEAGDDIGSSRIARR